MFSGISTFGRIPYHPCLASDEERYDIAFLGMDMTLGVESIILCFVYVAWLIHVSGQALPSTLGLPTDQELDSDPVAFDKARAD